MNASSTVRKIALVGGSWSSNIGNAYYNLGAVKLLEQVCGGVVYFVPESPLWKRNDLRSEEFDLIGNLDVDLVVLNGPCLNRRMTEIYGRTFRRLAERGVKWGVLSAGMSVYNEEERDIVLRFLSDHPPCFIVTRDRETYKWFLGEINGCLMHDGLCTSMYLDEAVSLPQVDLGEYHVLNFDTDREPIIDVVNDRYLISGPKSRLFGRRLPQELGGIPVVRINNNDSCSASSAIYFADNMYHSDLPWGYLTILKGAKCVFSERVHTCAAALVFGKQAQFIPISGRAFEKRSLLFERIGASAIYERPTSLDAKYITDEKATMNTFVRDVVASV